MDDITGVEPEYPLIHDREYRVRAYKVGADEMVLRGAVRDVKPPGVFLAGDLEPMTMHHMVVELRVSYPALEITEVTVTFETHPQEQCPAIIGAYQGLVGLSIARGFTHRVREMFGGPRGCTHTTALLYAMAPVAVQCWYALGRAAAGEDGDGPETDTQRRVRLGRNLDTCHAWSDGYELMTWLRDGAPVPAPIPLQRRLADLGVTTGDGWDWTAGSTVDGADRAPGAPHESS